MLILTLEITTTKKSVLNKVERACLTFQHFKNLIYLCADEYFEHTQSITPFANQFFLEKFVKGKEKLDFENEKIIKYQAELKELWSSKIGSDAVGALVRMISHEFKSIIAKWKQKQIAHIPKPRKLENLYTFTIPTNHHTRIDKRTLKRKPENALVVKLGKAFGAVKIKIPKSIKIKDVKLTWYKNLEVVFKISYETLIPNTNLDTNKWLSFDLGVNNLVACISNDENINSFLIDGKPLKAFNQWINKTSAKLQSNGSSQEQRRLWRYRDKRIKSFFNQIGNIIALLCVEKNIGKVILPNSLNTEYTRKNNKGRKFNQTFRYIPLGKLIQTIEFKCKLFGIEVIKQDESYTSQVSSLSGNIEILKNSKKSEISKFQIKQLNFAGKRIKRGLFRDLQLNKVFNADLNGALNLAIKALGPEARKQFLKLQNSFDKLARPIKLNLFKYPASLPLLRKIAGSISYSNAGVAKTTAELGYI